jgi:thiol:disulfide interchange protein DsbA
MQRRTFSALSLGALSSLPFTGAQAQAGFKEGTDYYKLSQAVPTEAANAFEPALSAWSKKLPKEVELKRVPVRFRAEFEPQQRAYYVLEALGKVEELQAKMFAAIHTEHQTLTSLEPLQAWAEKNGIPKKQFTDLFNSFAVIGKARRAAQLQELFKVEGVPALGVAGRFYVDGSLAGSMERALQIVDFLVAEVRKGR